MLRRLLVESAVHFLKPAKFENMANPDFENIKHLKTLGNVLLPISGILKPHSYHVAEKYH